MPTIISSGTLLAHQGGWDEVLLVGGPIVLIIVLLAIAKRRVDAQAATHDTSAGSAPTRQSTDQIDEA
jgi:hypothetical protein